MPLLEDYQVSLDSFHGPLDLLLYLIRRAEVDIHDISIARITDQYIAFLREVRDVDIEAAGEFLVMAATLIEIKARALAPASATGGDAGSGADSLTGAAGGGPADAPATVDLLDPRADLIRQLLQFQRYRIASDALEQRRVEFSMRRPRRSAPLSRSAALAGAEPSPDEPVEIELEDVHILDLAESYERIMASIDLARMGDHRVEIDDTPIALHQADLMDRLDRAPDGRLALQEAFAGRPGGQRIGLFLAALELTRLRRITVRQDDIHSAIVIERRPDGDDPESAPAPAPGIAPGVAPAPGIETGDAAAQEQPLPAGELRTD
jgi:segregation and condensation protein A